jgi:hypothetical protein
MTRLFHLSSLALVLFLAQPALAQPASPLACGAAPAVAKDDGEAILLYALPRASCPPGARVSVEVRVSGGLFLAESFIYRPLGAPPEEARQNEPAELAFELFDRESDLSELLLALKGHPDTQVEIAVGGVAALRFTVDEFLAHGEAVKKRGLLPQQVDSPAKVFPVPGLDAAPVKAGAAPSPLTDCPYPLPDQVHTTLIDTLISALECYQDYYVPGGYAAYHKYQYNYKQKTFSRIQECDGSVTKTLISVTYFSTYCYAYFAEQTCLSGYNFVPSCVF